MGLYRDLLGQEYERLAPSLQIFHDGPGAEGRFDVVWSPGWARWMACRIMQLPKPGSDLPTQLLVCAKNGAEVWDRTFEKSKLVTIQTAEKGYLCETKWPISFEFEVRIVDGGLDYSSKRTRILGCPLPSFLSVRIEATERPSEAGLYTRVRFLLPGLGQICQYEGELRST
ncbi:MAG: DUF4166 domain-containing protein [Armatimonadetes bacterium]|nr:DUF4166 domain-containing protein [Armatimonadota bacterium]